MTEQERKFLLIEMPKTSDALEIQQAYLMFEGNKHLRVRIIDNERAYLTFKTIHTSTIRTEYEYEIPITDAIRMYDSSNCKLRKTRHICHYNGNPVSIDVYPDGMAVVEIEYENELVTIPNFCGKEITDNPEYSNINIAIKQSLTSNH